MKRRMMILALACAIAAPGLSFAADKDKSRAEVKKTAEQAIDHIVKIMVIFILQTLVIPFLLLWALYGVLRGTFELPRQVVGVVVK